METTTFHRSRVNTRVDVAAALDKLGVDYETKTGAVDTHWFICPWHHEKTASCRVIDEVGDRRHGQVRCYGCHAGGWLMHLVMQVLECSQDEALDWLMDVSKPIPVPFSVALEVNVPGREKKALSLPDGFVSKQLESWPRAAREYAMFKRQLTDWQVLKWDIGYTPRRFHRTRNPHPGRIFIPVRDARGRLVNYTGRTYVDSPRRYKNGRRAEGADPASIFGEYHWPKSKGVVVVTEGALNALAVERVMPSVPVAALFGSQVYERHVVKLAQFGAVLIATDFDQAGDCAALELEERLARWTRAYRLQLPAGKDCDDLEPSELKERLAEFFVQYYSEVQADRRPRRPRSRSRARRP